MDIQIQLFTRTHTRGRYLGVMQHTHDQACNTINMNLSDAFQFARYYARTALNVNKENHPGKEKIPPVVFSRVTRGSSRQVYLFIDVFFP